MASVFALKGPSNSGKSDVLIRLFHNLQAKYPTATVQVLHGRSRDMKVVLRGIKGKTVGVESQGDPNSRLKESLAGFLAAGCDVIFCACRTSGMTLGWVNALAPPHRVQLVAQIRAARDHATANAAMAASLIRMADL
jgi:hypothetical protein